MSRKFLKSKLFPKPKSVGPRHWGKEILLVLINKKLSLKKIILKKNKKGGLQYHRKKKECGYIIKGRLKVIFDLGDGILRKRILKKGDVFFFPNGFVHQEIALTECEIIEASTPFFNDRVRVEKKYGLNELGGLPSTNIEKIKFL